jgi:cellulose synthase/poly-beta-1,6-N-acetylglucosamine synthase-like glycosyltransferase
LKNYIHTFSIVIPTYNEENYINNCIHSILQQDYDLSKIEIIVVDGGSTDHTLSIVKLLSKGNYRIKIVNNPVKKTPNALNIGIKTSNNEIVVILGAHTTIDKFFLFYNNKYLNETDAKVVGGTQINLGKNFMQHAIGLSMQSPFAMASAKYRWSKRSQYVDTVVYGAYRKEVFDEIGFFEDKFTISEDAELNWRIRKQGYKIYFSPEIKTFYYPRKSLKAFFKQMFRYGILRVNVLKKHSDSIKYYHLIPAIFTSLIIILSIAAIFDPNSLKILFWFFVIYFLINLFFSTIFLINKKMLFLPLVILLTFFMQFLWGLGFIFGFIIPKTDKL